MFFSSLTKSRHDSLSPLLAFESSIGFASNICRSAATLAEESREDWLDERPEDDLGPIGHGKSHPQNQDELEHVVEGEPVDGIDHALQDGEEGIDNPVCQPLCVIHLVSTEQCFQRVVSRNDESCKVDKELAPDVEEDEEEVEGDKAQEGIGLGDIGLLFEVVERWIFGELLVDLGDLVLRFILERHFRR